MAEIEYMYLTDQSQESCCTRVGSDLGSNEGGVMIIYKYLYGIKSSGVEFIALISNHAGDTKYF